MRNRIALGAVVMLSVMGAARAEGPDLIAVRQATFDLNGGSFGLIRMTVATKGDVTKLEDTARGMAKWAAVIPSMFPPGTDKGHDTKALPEIWSDSAGFQKAAMTYGAAATKLADDAKAGNAEEVAADTKALGESCGACHKAYRAK